MLNKAFAHLDSDLPVVFTGDFNAEPSTEEMELLSQNYTMADANLGNTFPVVDPVKKIDYIWVSKNCFLESPKIQIPNAVKHSDHLPLMAEIVLISN